MKHLTSASISFCISCDCYISINKISNLIYFKCNIFCNAPFTFNCTTHKEQLYPNTYYVHFQTSIICRSHKSQLPYHHYYLLLFWKIVSLPSVVRASEGNWNFKLWIFLISWLQLQMPIYCYIPWFCVIVPTVKLDICNNLNINCMSSMKLHFLTSSFQLQYLLQYKQLLEIKISLI